MRSEKLTGTQGTCRHATTLAGWFVLVISSLAFPGEVRADDGSEFQIDSFEYVSPTPQKVLTSGACVKFVARLKAHNQAASNLHFDILLTINGCRYAPFEITLISSASISVEASWYVQVCAPVIITEMNLRRTDGQITSIDSIRRKLDVIPPKDCVQPNSSPGCFHIPRDYAAQKHRCRKAFCDPRSVRRHLVSRRHKKQQRRLCFKRRIH